MQDPIEAVATPDIYKQRANSQQLSIQTTYSNFCNLFVSKFLPHFVQVAHLTCFWKKNLFLYTHRCNSSLTFLLKLSTHFPHKQKKIPCYQKLLKEDKVKLANIFLWKCRLFETSWKLINLGHILDMKDLGVILEKRNIEKKRQMLTEYKQQWRIFINFQGQRLWISHAI